MASDVVRRVPGGRPVLDGLSATFPAGSIVAVVGDNGAGKSTLARVLAGVDRADSGHVARPSRHAYFVAERVPALAACSTRTLAAALASTVGRDRRSIADRLDSALDALSFTHAADTSLRRLSKGNLQKAYLALAYALRPAVSILDEPTTGLDVVSARAAGELIRAVAADGGVVVVTAHEAVPYADVLQRLSNGRLVPLAEPTGAIFVVDLVVGRDASTWWGAGGPYEVLQSPSSTSDLLRLLVSEHSLSTVLRSALDHGKAVMRVVPMEPT